MQAIPFLATPVISTSLFPAPLLVAPLALAPLVFARIRSVPRQCARTLSTRVSALFLRSTAVDLAILAGHLLLYPTGISQEQPAHRPTPQSTPTPQRTPGAGPPPGSEPDTPGNAPSPTSDSPPLLPTAGRARPPVLLLHGFIDNRSVFVLLRRSLLRYGWPHVEALNYSPLTCDLRKAAELLGRHVEEVCARTGHPRVDIVGHSLGGLIARYYVQRFGGDARVRTLITLGTPHSGTRAVPLMSAHPIVRQMRPDSDVIAELSLPAPHCRTRFLAFWSDEDQIMVPTETARIDHPDLAAHNVHVAGVGHLALPVSGTVAAGIRDALSSADATGEDESAVSVA
ncbi:alpha/beta fold hydrolase [Streptomyces halobius]|uniref:Alpha/beta fold hydrolase n=1 Tax=Streptomyces halobius TaxID=2879846 RepID=A0ABY4M8P2_9ACTN|nr:alpha/beta fold hydrolase [Streptomyces halobius]UQA93523.1 alpha/beta fold hydrolase [Streptomyces halobius]